MIKSAAILMLVTSMVLQGCVNRTGELVKEVSALEVPERFKPRRIDEIVKKYIPMGISKESVKEILVSEGFEVAEISVQINEEFHKDCNNCDNISVRAEYSHRPMLWPLYDYGIVVQVRFRNGHVTLVNGLYASSHH